MILQWLWNYCITAQALPSVNKIRRAEQQKPNSRTWCAGEAWKSWPAGCGIRAVSLIAQMEGEAGPSDIGGTANCSGIANSENNFCTLVKSGRKWCEGTCKQARKMRPFSCLHLTCFFWPNCCVHRSLDSLLSSLEMSRRAIQGLCNYLECSVSCSE